ncbi:hypothetical protein V2J09_005539 [Rumex salicifolius]
MLYTIQYLYFYISSSRRCRRETTPQGSSPLTTFHVSPSFLAVALFHSHPDPKRAKIPSKDSKTELGYAMPSPLNPKPYSPPLPGRQWLGTSGANDFVSGPHIADVNILLPPRMTHTVESWDHHDILTVIPEYNKSNHCSTSARLRSISPYNGRKETAVYAADVLTGAVIRCKVFIDIFSRIQIFHSSIKLDLDGLATLRVHAFDAEENVFSSLVGLQFMWKLMPENDGSPHPLLHVPLKDSPLSDCSGLCGDLNIQKSLENDGVYSDLFVVRGVEIGREVVSVHLLEPQFNPMEDKIELTVAEAMSLDPPSPVFVLVGALVKYRLKVIRGNMPQVVALPSPFHRWAVTNSSVAEVDPMMGSAHVLRLGGTSVIVEDTRVAGNVQVSSLHVVLPDSLVLYLLPLSVAGDPVEGIEPISSAARWYVVSGRQYLIDMKVFSGGLEAQEIYITENEELHLNYDQSKNWISYPVSESAAIKYGWKNSRILDVASPGLGKLSASLAYLGADSETKQILTVMQKVMVCDKVEFRMEQQAFESSRIVLPWAQGVHQELQLTAVGGCAQGAIDYKWVSSDVATVSVSAAGLVQARRPGKVTIKVVSVFDMLNFDELVIEVHVPASIVMLPNLPVETVVGSYILSAVTMKTSDGDCFYICDAFSSSISWKTGSESFLIVNSTIEAFLMNKVNNDNLWTSVVGPPCSWTRIYATKPGRTTVLATVSKEHKKSDHLYGGPVIMQASSPIASFLPLDLHQAGDGNQYGGYWIDLNKADLPTEMEKLEDLHLVPGTSMDIEIVGGPEKWGEDVEFLETVNVIDDRLMLSKEGELVQQIPYISRNLYRIFCPTLGNFKLIFKRGNLAGTDHFLPVLAEAQLSLVCAFPSSIVVLADAPVNAIDVIKSATQIDHTSGHIRSMPITVANERTIRLSAVGLSSSAKAFANSSSLTVSWELNNCNDLAFWDEAYYMTVSKSSWERFLVLKNASGLCTVHALVHDFQAGSKNVLTDDVQLKLVSTLKLSPEFNLLFIHPDAQNNLSVTGGSCFLDAALNDSRVVEVIQPSPGLCSQLTLAPKAIGIALVTVHDIGLSPPQKATSVVQVADVEWMKITSGDEISIMEGDSQNIALLAGINDGLTFESSQYIYMNIFVHIEDHIIDLVDDDIMSSPADGYIKASNFTICGRHTGVTTLHVSARQKSGLEIRTQSIKVEVYAPPILHPHDIILAPGASYVLILRGGPSFGIAIEYTILDDKTAKIEQSSGRVLATSPGNTSVTATIYGSGKTVISQAYGNVRVVVPTSMKLNVQSKQLAVGLEGDLYSFYELCHNYQWSIENEEVLVFQEVSQPSGKRYISPSSSQEDKSERVLDQIDVNFIRVLYARSAGRTKISLKFSCDYASGSFSKSVSYESDVTIRVVSNPPLALGIPATWVLPPHYTTSRLLPSSSEAYSKWNTQNPKNAVTYSVLGHESVTDEHRKKSISIDENKIRTTDNNNLACIQAKDHTTGRTEVACCVRVAEVAQIRIAKVFTSHVVDLTVGTELEIMTSYTDNLGNPFHEAYGLNLPDADTNRGDIVVVDSTNWGNGSIIVKALHNGKALVRVRLNHDPHKSDYILISVGAHIHPRNHILHTGGIAKFCIRGLGEQVSGRWASANRSVLMVDSVSGEARALGEGATTVTYDSFNFTLQTTVTVLKGNSISVDAPGEILTNAPSPTRGYNFAVKLSSESESPKENVQVPYDCKVEPPFIGYAKPWSDAKTANTYCLFFPYSPEHLVRALPPSKDMRHGISVSIHASIREAPDVSGYGTALFLGGFSVLDMDKIKALGNKPLTDKIIFILPTNGQRLEVDVIYNPVVKELITPFWKLILVTAMLAVLTFIIIQKCYMPHMGRASSRPQQSTSSATPSRQAPVTPDRRSPASGSDQSPRTPPPFMDYVRRTIDETPYYRRNARRDNIQNTY